MNRNIDSDHARGIEVSLDLMRCCRAVDSLAPPRGERDRERGDYNMAPPIPGTLSSANQCNHASPHSDDARATADTSRPFPLTPALSRRERECHHPPGCNVGRPGLPPSRALILPLLARIFQSPPCSLINTVASARCANPFTIPELFQQFFRRGEKPLKRLTVRSASLHRAKATVLMRGPARWCEMSGLAGETNVNSVPAFNPLCASRDLWKVRISLVASILLFFVLAGRAEAGEGTDTALPFPLIQRFENFGQEHGIPSYKVHAVLKTSEGQVWIGTWDGLCVRQENGQFKRYGPEHGLSHKMVLSMVEDPATGDLWVGTMRGLNKFSGGKITRYLQTDSGLPNNVVYGVDIVNDHVWVATAAGAGSLNLKTGLWRIYDHNNSIMHEPWCYAIKGTKDLIYIGVWGAGIVEHDPAKGSFKEYRDPDGDFHFDLAPDDGPINDITSWLAWSEGLLWQCTYFGFSCYDGKFWKTWVQDKTPLPSNFLNFAWPVGRYCWVGSDRGASVTDGSYWVNYLVGEKGEGIIEIHRPGKTVEKRTMSTALANGFVLGIWADANEAWFATSKGLSRGLFSTKPAAVKMSQANSTRN